MGTDDRKKKRWKKKVPVTTIVTIGLMAWGGE